MGAGEGSLLAALDARGRKADGIERDSARPTIRAGTLDEEVGDRAAVVFWHSLEHLPEPGHSLETAAKLLRPDGVLVIVVPNSASLQARVFGDRWFGLDLPRHLVHLSSQALFDRLRLLGFAVERVSYIRGGQILFGWLYGLIDLLPGRPSLYDAIRRPQARSQPLSATKRLAILVAALVLLPVASIAAAIEVIAHRGGSLYVEARCT